MDERLTACGLMDDFLEAVGRRDVVRLRGILSAARLEPATIAALVDRPLEPDWAVRVETVRRFRPGDRAEVARFLRGLVLPFLEVPSRAVDRARVQLALVKLSGGDVEVLRRVGKDATVDWRDVLVAAGMANGDWREVLAGQGFAVPDCHERDPPSIPERAVARGPHRRQRRGTAAPRSEPRAATRLDAPAILSINRDGVPGVSPLAPSDVERFLAISPFFRVVERASIVGYLIGIGSDADYDGEEFLWFRGRFADFVYVDQVAVARDARGTGVATLLYADLERFAIARRSPRLALEVNLRPENRPSLAFHDRLGFAEIGRLETADGRLVSLRSKSPGPAV